MKVLYRIPTRQYAYIEIEQEISDTPEEVIRLYFLLEAEYRKQADELNKAKTNDAPFENEGDITCGIGKTRNEYLNKSKK